MFNNIFNFFIFSLYIYSIQSLCPPDLLIKPCLCVNLSIICEHIDNSTFDLQEVFIILSSFSDLISEDDENATNFDQFILSNTSIEYLPENVFINITFKNLIFKNNLQLTTIDQNAFTYFQDYVESFETLNTNLSDSKTIFLIIKQFQNLRFLSLQNDQLKTIPNYAFNHTYLSHIYFGLEHLNQTQPIETIGNYAFYNLPNLHFLRIFSPNLRKINKYTFALRNRSILNNENSNMLELYLGGKGLNSTSFELTSLNRFRNRFVFLRFYSTNITYLDENIFQPFLESNPLSLIDINDSNLLYKCSCESSWIQNDYFKNPNQLENRVYGYRCWDYNFTNCKINQ